MEKTASAQAAAPAFCVDTGERIDATWREHDGDLSMWMKTFFLHGFSLFSCGQGFLHGAFLSCNRYDV